MARYLVSGFLVAPPARITARTCHQEGGRRDVSFSNMTQEAQVKLYNL
jgi:hypothetical protein